MKRKVKAKGGGGELMGGFSNNDGIKKKKSLVKRWLFTGPDIGGATKLGSFVKG